MDSVTTSQIISPENFANLMGVSRATVQKWIANGTYIPDVIVGGRMFYSLSSLRHIPLVKDMLDSSWNEELQTKPLRPYTSIELFAGVGWLWGWKKQASHISY